MKKKRLFRKCLPFLLSASLLLAPAAAVFAENTAAGDAVTGEPQIRYETEYTDAGEAEVTEEYTEEKKEGNQDTESCLTEEFQETDPAPGNPGTGETAAEEQEEAFAETEQEEEFVETPYQELLSDASLVIVTVEQGSGENQSEERMETVGNLSEQKIEALENYIEDQGFEVTKEAMLAEAASTQVRTITFYMSGFLSYELAGYGTAYDAVFIVNRANFKGNGNAFCIEPEKQSPGHDQQNVSISYTTTVRDYTDSLLVKIMYYGFGGPGDITGGHAPTPTARHILTHMAATRRAKELGIPGAGNYTYRANATAISKADALYNAIKAKPDIQGRVSVLTPVAGLQTIMLLADYQEKPTVTKADLSVTKTVSGSAGNKNTEFHFQLKLTPGAGQTVPKTVNYVIRETGKADRSGTLEQASGSNTFLFTLMHGQKIIFRQLETGLTYEVTELDGEEQGYTVTAEHASGKLPATGASAAFTNNKEMIIPTGADLHTGLQGMLMAASGILPACMAVLKKRRKR